MLGSLLPDLDAKDSKIMHGWWKPFGLFGRYAFYKPLKFILRERSNHREIVHSLIGCLITSLFYGLVSLILSLLGVFFIWYIWIGIVVGFILHLIEDSFTYSGVKWFYPKGDPITSTTITNSGGEYFLLFVTGIVFGSWASLAYYLIPPSIIAAFLIMGVSLILLVILHRFNSRISDLGDRRYSIEQLVVLYYEDQGGKEIKPPKPSGSILELQDVENLPVKQYIAKITGVGGRFGLQRDWLVSPVACGTLTEDDVIEIQIYEKQRKKRIYYIVQNGTFHAFLQKLI